ncbi:MAG: ribonuclease P protein component [Christensenellaceae bacterium]|jgi:ribonuclease P protein component|nr:ribonuclease P protein component [Christensenellaceae bacterium]
MLPIRYRLKKRKQFAYIYRQGRKAGGAFVNVVYCGAGNSNSIKIGFTANKKVGNSVVRHRAVRLMRESVKPFLPLLKLNNYIFVAREGITEQHLLYITIDIEKTLKKAGLLK